ncbi:MAG: hypothetical protein KQH53_03400 [Desulfarculaceae bacterium]|nr:hypothetical protein [Desulfarculaceae bacterium]
MDKSKNGQEVTKKYLSERVGKLLLDVDAMVDYVGETGKEMSQELIGALAELDCERGVLTTASVNGETCETEYSNLIKVHNLLLPLVAPATPASLQATERKGLGLFINNFSVNLILILTTFSLVALLVLYVGVKTELFKTATSAAWAKAANDWRPHLMILLAAMLGSGLYFLNVARGYILNRTFNPQYHLAYYIRYFMGVVSGVILGCFGPELIDFASEEGKNADELSTVVLALVGGFAAEAVLQILQRVGDTLLTLVRGSDKAVAEKKGEAARAEAGAAVAKAKGELAVKLQGISNNLDGENKQKINELIKKITP